MVTRLNELLIEPHVGVGPLRFGMSAQEVHQICGEPQRRRGPLPFTGCIREHFEQHHFFVDFGRDGRCCSIEMYPGARVMFRGSDLMGMTYHQLVRFLRSAGVTVTDEGDGFRCDAFGLAGYCPDIADPDLSDAAMQSVFAYVRGYYDELDAERARNAPMS